MPLMLKHAVGPSNKYADDNVSKEFLLSFQEAKSFNKDVEGYAEKASDALHELKRCFSMMCQFLKTKTAFFVAFGGTRRVTFLVFFRMLGRLQPFGLL